MIDDFVNDCIIIVEQNWEKITKVIAAMIAIYLIVGYGAHYIGPYVPNIVIITSHEPTAVPGAGVMNGSIDNGSLATSTPGPTSEPTAYPTAYPTPWPQVSNGSITMPTATPPLYSDDDPGLVEHHSQLLLKDQNRLVRCEIPYITNVSSGMHLSPILDDSYFGYDYYYQGDVPMFRLSMREIKPDPVDHINIAVSALRRVDLPLGQYVMVPIPIPYQGITIDTHLEQWQTINRTVGFTLPTNMDLTGFYEIHIIIYSNGNEDCEIVKQVNIFKE